MRLFHVSSLFLVFAVGGIVLACGDDDVAMPTGTASDAGPDAITLADAGAEPVTDNDAGSDAGPPAACANVAGAYAITGTCTSTLVVPPSVMCIRQKDCALTGKDDFPNQVLTGTATATTVTATAESPAHQDCTGEVKDGKLGTLACTGTGITCTMTAAPAPIANATDYCCDVLAQDCPSGSRCQPMGSIDKVPLVNACVPDRGTVELGAACTRASTATADVGNDDCKKGLYCSNGGQPATTSRVCRKLCKNNPDCTKAGQACFNLTGIDAGFCMERCSIFNGTACGTGNTCRVLPSVENDRFVFDQRCDFVGAVAAGAACQFHTDCAAGLACNDANKCAPYCDSTHPCATGTCKTGTGPAAAGFDTSTGLCN